VMLGSVPITGFKGVGSTSGQRAFKIVLNCRAGQNAKNTVHLRLDALEVPNHEGVLQIAQGGGNSASGVGIQLLDNHAKAVTFGEDVQVGPSMDGTYELPYTARYFQTGAVMPGRADGTATFTVSYK
jgi:type 1 fimbria pilin